MNVQAASTPVRRPLLALFLAAAVAAFLVIAATARADSPIEGVWSFNGGRIAIKAAGGGNTFQGTVVSPTKFAQCTHEVGEPIWTQISPQPDGSFWGLHQWFFENGECTPNPSLGPTAWRVLSAADGSRFLRVCFSEPGSNQQPTITPDGTGAEATFGCVDSALVSSVSDISGESVDRYVKFPAATGCIARNALRIRMRDPKNDPISKVAATVRSGGLVSHPKVKKTKTGAVLVVHPATLAGARFVVSVHFVTVLGQKLHAKRSYSRCATGQPKKRRKHGHKRAN